MPSFACRICQSDISAAPIQAKELSIGLGGAFQYFECNNCGCLQIREKPGLMDRYYDFNFPAPLPSTRLSRLQDKIRQWRNEYLLLGHALPFGLPSDLLAGIKGSPRPAIFELLRGRVSTKYRVLDVGCGSGGMLRTMQRMGFADLSGLEPFGKEMSEPGLRIMTKTLLEFDDIGQPSTPSSKFDLIMFNQSLEHIFEQKETLAKAVRLLKSGGLISIAIPLKSAAVWSRYGVFWANMDPPRHFFLHTSKSLQMLASEAGLQLVARRDIADGWWYILSEQYQKGLTNAQAAPQKVYWDSNASKADPHCRELRQFAKELNEKGEGDLAVFVFSKKSE